MTCTCKCKCTSAITWEQPEGYSLSAFNPDGLEIGWIREQNQAGIVKLYRYDLYAGRNEHGHRKVLVDTFRNVEAAKAALEKVYSYYTSGSDDD